MCNRWVARWKKETGSRIEYEPSFNTANAAIHFIPAGSKQVLKGPLAIFEALSRGTGRKSATFLAQLLNRVPAFKFIADRIYALIARNRITLSLVEQALSGPDPECSTYHNSARIFVHLIGCIYIVAFVSLALQARGLFGEHGIVPALETFQKAREAYGLSAIISYPSLLWFNSSDFFILFLCWGGATFGALLMLGLAKRIAACGAWIFFLSVQVAGGPFLQFQWDTLLTEAGFLTIGLTIYREGTGAWAFLFRWLLFRLVFSSGFVKLASGDEAWLNLTALHFHYETQPLPHFLSYYAHQLPSWFHRLSAFFMFVLELVVPFLFFMPRRLKRLAFLLSTIFQLLIIATGNFAFFNWLTIALGFFLIDDLAWKRMFPLITIYRLRNGRITTWFGITLLLWVSYSSVIVFTRQILGRSWLPSIIEAPSQPLETLRAVNTYGLFARMTTIRNEIVIVGSNDLSYWQPYEFKWKPGDPTRMPCLVAPHQPRLDWQMWFAALGPFEQSPWLASLLAKMLEGSKDTLALLDKNPFPSGPPKYIRAYLFHYRFTSLDSKSRTGHWWEREPRGPYGPVLSHK